MIQLMPFQEDAIKRLSDKFKELWKSGARGVNLIFQAPTGAGKTIMMAQFLKDLVQDPLFDVDKCFVWISMGGNTLTQQSKKKLYDFYDGAGEINLLDVTDLSKKKMVNNEVFFINWGKIKTSTADGRILRRETENTMQGVDGGIFDEFILNTQAENREIVLIIDESHRESNSKLADEIVELIKPKIKLLVSATPKERDIEDVYNNRVDYVFVPHNEVIKAGLIKEKIITQTEENLKQSEEENIDEKLLSLAIEKRNELKESYYAQGIQNINPLVLIQIPNKKTNSNELEEEERVNIIKEYLISRGVQDFEIGIWLSEKKEHLQDIVKNNSDISFLIFKQAVSTGWDCPRAQILVMFREINNPTFHIQTVGRVLRMPEAKHYDNSKLNRAYLYTNYRKNEVFAKENELGGNKLANNISCRKDTITPIELETTYLRRQDYNDLKPVDYFQNHLIEKFDEYFEIESDSILIQDNIDKIQAKGLIYNIENPPYDILVDAEIDNYDNFAHEMYEAHELGVKYSSYDTQRMYDKLCHHVIVSQDDERGKYAPARSWGILKSALNVWITSRIESDREKAYNILVNDLLKEDSVLKILLEQVFISYREISDNFLGEQAERKKEVFSLSIPPEEDTFTNDYSILETNKSAMEPFYNKKTSIKNETSFINYLESKDEVEWWYKNGESSKEYFAVPYNNNKSLFYPDWFVKLVNGKCLILDTKAGFTAEETHTKPKMEALQEYIRDRELSTDFIAGIVVRHSDIWKVNIQEEYNHDENYSEFKPLDEIISNT